jgi:hypothetical protein
MKILTVDKENLTDAQLSKVNDLFAEIYGDEFKGITSERYTFTLMVEVIKQGQSKDDMPMELFNKIKRINTILDKCFNGSVTTAELEADSSPCISSKGTNKMNVSVLVERFSINNVGVVTYNNETEIGEDDMSYEELDEEIIDEILELLEQAEVELDKTWKRCQD